MATLLGAFDPADVRRFAARLGPDLFAHLAGRTPDFLQEFARAWKLTDGDAAAQEEIARALGLTRGGGGGGPAVLQAALHEYSSFMEQYPGRVSGDLISHFRRAVLGTGDPLQARAEIEFARDILEGRTPLGVDQKVHGIEERRGGPNQNRVNPEYRVTAPDQTTRVTEVKRVGAEGGQLSKNGLKNNLGDAIHQVIGESSHTGERGGYIRLDARHTTGTQLTVDQITRAIIGEMVSPRDKIENQPLPQGQVVRGIEFVEWVEVLYNEAGQPQRLLFQVVNGQIVQVP